MPGKWSTLELTLSSITRKEELFKSRIVVFLESSKKDKPIAILNLIINALFGRFGAEVNKINDTAWEIKFGTESGEQFALKVELIG